MLSVINHLPLVEMVLLKRHLVVVRLAMRVVAEPI